MNEPDYDEGIDESSISPISNITVNPWHNVLGTNKGKIKEGSKRDFIQELQKAFKSKTTRGQSAVCNKLHNHAFKADEAPQSKRCL